MHPVIEKVTRRIRDRSSGHRDRYLAQMDSARREGPSRGAMSCTNLAHSVAAKPRPEKLILRQTHQHSNIGIVSAYNELLSAHQPYGDYPDQIRRAVSATGNVAQFAAGVPAMCDGITQGQPGMELSLFSRDVIAQATGVALTHNIFDGVLCLGICDKIVPGMLMGALRFGHLPLLFIPAGPMPSGLSNQEKAAVRGRHARGDASDEELMDAESRSYHSPGTCTFYGTANTNQILMEVMGLHLPGSAFINPGTPLREALTAEASRHITRITDLDGDYRPLSRIVCESSLVNAMVALLATGGSTNHSIHLVAIARAAGIVIDWQDFDDLSRVVPLLARVYPNGEVDINAFDAAGGVPFLVRELLEGGWLNGEVPVAWGDSLWDYTAAAALDENGSLYWQRADSASRNTECLRGRAQPFHPEGGLRLLTGNLGRAVIKTSAVPEDRLTLEEEAIVFSDQAELQRAYKAGELNRNFVAVLPGQGPKANGMPELHKLMPVLTNLQADGYRVALVTDGRMSGASGKVPAAIHCWPEAMAGGEIGQIRTGDRLALNARQGRLEWIPARERQAATHWGRATQGYGRELFSGMRTLVSHAEAGACTFDFLDER